MIQRWAGIGWLCKVDPAIVRPAAWNRERYFFSANVCGDLRTVELASLAREARSCSKSSSSPRTRAIIRT
jgi:hypothetical protein